MSASTPASEVEKLFLANLPLVEGVVHFVARRHHLSSTESDDFSSRVKLALIEEDYAILRKFEGRSSLRTFLTVVISRMLLDDRIRAWGKWRPSAEARRLGPVALLLEQLMVRDGHPFEESCEILTTNHRVTMSRAELERLAEQLPSRVARRIESADHLTNVRARESAEDDVLETHSQALRDRVLTALQDVLGGLPTQDRLILTLRFLDGRKVVEIADMLHLEAKVLYRRIENLLGDMRSALEARGLDAVAVADLLADGR